MPDVLAVTTNWRRPQNLRSVVDALRAQSVPVHIAVVESAAGTEFAAPPDVLADVDTVMVISREHDIGPCKRFLPPLALPAFEWTFFAVDDHVPGEQCVEWMLETDRRHIAASVGQDGRRVVGQELQGRRIRCGDTVTPVDALVSSELVRTAFVPYALEFRSRLIKEFGDAVSLFEDDLILQFGIARAIGSPCLLTPAPPTAAESWRAARLPAPHALSARPDHRERRDRFVKQAIQLGWRSSCHD